MKNIWLFFVILFLSVGLINFPFHNSFSFETSQLKTDNYKIRVNVNSITQVNSPSEVLATDVNSVTYQEVELSLVDNVFSAVKKLSPIATKTDYSFRIYNDDLGNPYKNLNLNGIKGIVYVRINASLSSQILVGASNYISIILPPGTETIVSLNNLKYIASPDNIKCNNSSAVTYNEIQSALASNIFSAVYNLVSDITTDDYEYFLAKNNKGELFDAIDLEGKTDLIYVKVTSITSSTKLKDESEYIEVTLPLQKVDLKKIKSITNNFIEISAKNLKSVEYSELKEQLIYFISLKISKVTFNVEYGKDYDFSLNTNNISNTYDNINLYQQTGDVYIKIKANYSSKILIGETSNLIVPLLGERVDISEINKINLDIHKSDFKDVHNVSTDELHNALKDSVLKSIQQNVLQATYIDFDFKINQSLIAKTFSLVDLTKKNQEIYIKIISNSESVIVKGNTKNFIIKLPYYSESNFSLKNLSWIILLAVVSSVLFFLLWCEIQKYKKNNFI